MARQPADMLPRGTLAIAGGLVFFALAATSLVRVLGVPPSASPVALRAQTHVAAVETRNLRFLDRRDGAVVILDVATGHQAGLIAAGEKTALSVASCVVSRASGGRAGWATRPPLR